MKLSMPIGVDDFKKVRENYYFVDKSRFLSAFFPGHAEVTLFTRPRRFGKTLTLSMLRYFFDLEGADEHRQLFDGLAVSHDAAMMAEMGQRPVLFFTLRGWKARDWEEMKGTIAIGLQKVAKQYKFLLESDRVDSHDRSILKSIYEGHASLLQLRTAPELLLGMLEAHYDKKAVLLLDEYDTPIQTAWEYGYYNEAIDFFRVFLTTALKTNLSLDFAVMTGVLRISKESIFSDLNNLFVDSILRPKYPTVFGFTSEEVEKMANDLGHVDKLPEIKAWYDGYRIDGHEIYNPWSVLNYFDAGCQPQTYWGNTSGNAILAELMKSADQEHFESLDTLLRGGTVTSYLRDGVIYSDIGDDPDALCTMLCTTGYLTTERTETFAGETEYSLRLPNLEMRRLFGIEIVKRYQHGFGKSALVRLLRAFLNGDAAKVEEGLGRYLVKLASYYDTAKDKESFYHGFVLGMTAILVEDFIVRSNRESGYGRYDLVAVPKRKDKAGFLLEFKTAETEDALDAKAEEALVQIETRDYLAGLDVEGRTMHRYGIAFCGKKVRVKMN
ncbi:MAG: ATP-binding protein [Veillonellaceae bacterium]|uniref:AAA family ATPase n=1 Tax=uncultured Selenomonas sp. TaxID=159275 RepID=UPI0025F48A48|nr:AAA family ATPase [uncultured Selenomonas sp.]MCI7541089.1 ATP-binding protein [Veillonellaceae bacterium]